MMSTRSRVAQLLRSVSGVVALMTLSGCLFRREPAYVPMGESRMELEGTYAVRVTELATTCDWRTPVRQLDVEVFYASKDVIRMLIDGQPYDLYLRANGRFESKTARTFAKKIAPEKRNLSGQFKPGRFSARLTITRASTRPCDEVALVEGTRK
jgi:hypothetical protein